MSGGGVNHEPGGLIDNEEVIVFVDDAQGDRFGPQFDWLRFRNVDFDQLVGFELRAWLCFFSLDGDVTLCEECLNIRAREMGQLLRNPAVYALTFRLWWHSERAQARRSASGCS